MTSIPDTLRTTLAAICALPQTQQADVPTQLQAQQPHLRWLEECCNQQALAGDAGAVQRLTRVWLRAWHEAVGTLPRQ